MFSEKRSTPGGGPTLERNIIGKNTSFTGDISSEGDFRIDGHVKGTIKTRGRVVIGQSGSVDGNIECTNADVEGKFSGNLSVDQLLSLKSTANISGEVVLGKLSVEPGAAFNAACTMKGSVKALKNNEPPRPEQKVAEKTA